MSDVTMRQMDNETIVAFCPERAAWAAFVPVGSIHEVLNDQLATAFEQIGERFRTVRPFELVSLLYSYPREFAAFLTQKVTQLGELFLPGKVCFARLDPRVARNYLAFLHHRLLFRI